MNEIVFFTKVYNSYDELQNIDSDLFEAFDNDILPEEFEGNIKITISYTPKS